MVCTNDRLLRRGRLNVLASFCLLTLSSVAISQESALAVVVDTSPVAIESLLREQSSALRKQILESPDLLERFVKTELLQKVLLKEAQRIGVDRQPTVVAKINQTRDQVVVDQFLQQKNEPPLGYPTAAEADSFYQKNIDMFVEPPMIRLAQILVRGPMEWPRQQRLTQLAKVKEANDRILKKEDFAAVAKEYSEDSETNERGGDLGWVPEKNVFPLVRLAIELSPLQGVTPPIRTQFGWQIVKVLDRRPGRALSFVEARNDVINVMRKERREQLQEQYLRTTEEQIPYRVNADELSKLRKILLK